MEDETTADITTSTSVSIDAPVEQVWRAITTPDLIKGWFFGVDTRSSWTVGGELVHTGELNGRPYEDKGVIVRIEPPTLLEHTHWSPMAGRPDRSENYETVTYRLVDVGGTSEVTVSEVDLPSEEAKRMSEQAWRSALDALKDQCEGGRAGV
jgi:uncharacterized protein YndB with AHSA1/START domain